MAVIRGQLISALILACVAALSCGAEVTTAAPAGPGTSRILAMLDKYNEVWETPSKSQQGSMPIGNGEIGLNVWVEENGDLLFYIARTDAWSGNGRILKLGRVRVSLDPNPFAENNPFRQELRLADGEIAITAGAEGKAVRLRVWVDANRPVIHVEADSDQPLESKVSLEVGGQPGGNWLPAAQRTLEEVNVRAPEEYRVVNLLWLNRIMSCLLRTTRSAGITGTRSLSIRK